MALLEILLALDGESEEDDGDNGGLVDDAANRKTLETSESLVALKKLTILQMTASA